MANGAPSENGKALWKGLGDRSRFQFKTDELDLADDVRGVKLYLKSLSVDESEALPSLTRIEDGKETPDSSPDKLAAVFAAVVTQVEIDGETGPPPNADEVLEFLGDWPAVALNKVLVKFGELTGNREEQSAAAGTFPGPQ